MIEDRKDGRWANDCDLCSNERKVGFGAFRAGQEPECPWCRSVRLAYGSYWYPITKSNAHLFCGNDAEIVGEKPKEKPLKSTA